MIEEKNNIFIVKKNIKPKIVCFTCITNEYDNLLQIKEFENIDFVCFSDSIFNSDTFQWKIRPIPQDLKSLSPVLQQRLIKINPYKYLSEYDISIWLDGNIEITSIKELLSLCDFKQYSFYIRQHPLRNDIKSEADAIILAGKAHKKDVYKQINKYLEDGYPDTYGLVESGIIVQQHNLKANIDLANLWTNEVLNGTQRDQLSFNYCCWKLNFKYGVFNQTLIKQLYSIKSHNVYDAVQILICNYNTNKLTNDCIRSIVKHIQSFKYKITIFDNSDVEPFQLDDDIDELVYVYDNTSSKYVNFDDVLKKSEYDVRSKNDFASLKHAYSIHYVLQTTRYSKILLFDSDTILLRDVDFINDMFITVASIEYQNVENERLSKEYPGKTRFCPFIQFFNVAKMNEHKLRYFSYKHMHGIIAPNGGNEYDTGAHLYYELTRKQLPYAVINYREYINHIGGASWCSK